MKDILDEIIAHKRREIALQKSEETIEKIIQNTVIDTPLLSMRECLAQSQSGIIAEFKRRSPSKGFIKQDADASIIPNKYEKAGATAISILTDTHFFGGNMTDIITARKNVSIPILRKDFIIDEYQLFQTKRIGANAVLLIAAAISQVECKRLTYIAHELGLEVLLEIHSEQELDYVSDEIDMIGVNNRNLGTFHTDVQNSFRLAQLLPKNKLLVSESGIASPDTVKLLREAGFRGFLIGENFMKNANPATELNQFIQAL